MNHQQTNTTNTNKMDKLFFYSKSANKYPGKGVNEYVVDEKIYKELNEIKDWRKILSNLHNHEFVFEEKTYNSVEHAFQAKKIEMVDETKAHWFCKNSNNIIGMSDGLIARKNRKIVILSSVDLMKWNNVKKKTLHEILLAKFTQISIAKQALLLTRDATLLHGTRGTPIHRQYELEEVRNLIK